MKKKILALLAVFSVVAMAGGIYLAYSFERTLSNFENIIMLHNVENLREHLLQNIRKVEVALYSQNTLHPESIQATESWVSDIELSINNCYTCHHIPIVEERLDDLRNQIEQYKTAISGIHEGKDRRIGAINAHLIGESLMGKIETMVVTTSEKLREKTEDSIRRANSMKIAMIGLISAGPVIMIIFAVVVLGGVTTPVGVLVAAVRTLKRGDLGHRISGLKNEFGELAVAFNDMAGSLQATMQAIEESEARYRLLFQTAADAIFVLEGEGSEAGRILQANQAAAAMHGYTLEELTTMKIQDLDTPASAADSLDRINLVLRGEWIKLELNHQRKDGSVFPVEVSAGLLETEGHKYVLAIDRDITERKRVEKALKRAEEIRMCGELATGLAHEIKNPLAGIKVSMEALSEENYLSGEDRGVLKRVIDEIKRIELLMQGLLNFAQPPKPHLLTTNVNEVLGSVIEFIDRECSRTRAQTNAITFNHSAESGIPDIMADPMQLKQIFMNLLLNAVDAMPGGGTVTVRTAFNKDNNAIVVELSDTGVGIDDDTLAKIFNPFFTTKEKGTGLGLSITKRLVEEHGGKIRLENNRTGGVTCRMIFPAGKMEGALRA